MQRRAFLIQLGHRLLTAAAVLATPKTSLAAWPAAHFAAGEFRQRFAEVFGDAVVSDSVDIQLALPDVAENGAVVPLTISSTLEGIEKLYIWVEKNPTPLAAQFDWNDAVELFLTARIKMAESCSVIVIAKQGERLLRAQRWVKVMQSGCGTG